MPAQPLSVWLPSRYSFHTCSKLDKLLHSRLMIRGQVLLVQVPAVQCLDPYRVIREDAVVE